MGLTPDTADPRGGFGVNKYLGPTYRPCGYKYLVIALIVYASRLFGGDRALSP